MSEHTAKISRGWLARFFLFTLAMLTWGVWSLYDGAIGYPSKQARWVAYEELQTGNSEKTWDEIALSNNWSNAVPNKEDDHKNSTDIIVQYIMAAVCLGIATFILILIITRSRKEMKVDNEAFYAITGEKIPFESITKINKDRWDSKLIAVISYTTGQGIQKTTIIDDWVYHGADKILETIEDKCSKYSIITSPKDAKQNAEE